MRLDVLSLFSDGQEICETSTESDVVDLKTAGIAEVECFIVARFDTKGHGCKSVTVKGADDSSWVDLAKVSVTDTEAGAGINVRVPQGCPRKLKLVYAGSGMKGHVTAGVTLQAPSPRGKRIGDFAAN